MEKPQAMPYYARKRYGAFSWRRFRWLLDTSINVLATGLFLLRKTLWKILLVNISKTSFIINNTSNCKTIPISPESLVSHRIPPCVPVFGAQISQMLHRETFISYVILHCHHTNYQLTSPTLIMWHELNFRAVMAASGINVEIAQKWFFVT